MTPDDYLSSILRRISAQTGLLGPGNQVLNGLTPTIRGWATTQLIEVKLSGSYAKGTCILGGTDVDLFISLSSTTLQTLKEIYDSLAAYFSEKGYKVRRQNVSIGITYTGKTVDLVPGKKQTSYGSDHSLYVSRQNTWTKTNVDTHIRTVSGSRNVDVVKLMKHWRTIHNLDFPSFAVELAVLKALEGVWLTGLADRFLKVLEFLRDRISLAALPDPANASNNVANDMTAAQKGELASAARASLSKQNWNEVLW